MYYAYRKAPSPPSPTDAALLACAAPVMESASSRITILNGGHGLPLKRVNIKLYCSIQGRILLFIILY